MSESTQPGQSQSISLLRRALSVFVAFWRTAPILTMFWWVLLIVGAVLPALFAVLMGHTVGAVLSKDPSMFSMLVATSVGFFVLQITPHFSGAISQTLGHRIASEMNQRLVRGGLEPDGVSHLEDPALTVKNDFDRGGNGPPLSLAIDFIRGSLLQLFVGLVSAVALAWYSWWAAVVLAVAWASTHWLLKESAMWEQRGSDDVARAEQQASYAYELAVEPWAAKEVRLFGLGGWAVGRFIERRLALHDAQTTATRLRRRRVFIGAAVVVIANVIVFGRMGNLALSGEWSLASVITASQLAVGVQWIAFGGLGWALDDVAAEVLRTERVLRGIRQTPDIEKDLSPVEVPQGAVGISVQGLRFRYPRSEIDIYHGLDLQVRPGESLALVGVNGAGKTSLAKLLCRFYDPTDGVVLVDGVDLRRFDVESWRARIAVGFQDFVRFERSLRDNVDPGRRHSDEAVLDALRAAGADGLAELASPMSKRFEGGAELSGGQWQRIVLARVLCAVRGGAGLVILDEPTANLDIRAEEEIFNRLLGTISNVTTILISHRLSTVRKADRIAVLADGRIAECGSHGELMKLDGHYKHMFELQASRFADATVGVDDD